MRQVAIIGLAPSTHGLAPYRDPSWERWGLPWDPHAIHYDVLFEMHDRRLWPLRGDGYEDRLREFNAPVYMQRTHEDIPNAVGYPFPYVIELTGDYFNSSVAYMLGMAIWFGQGKPPVTRIGIWGVDLHEDEEYAYQRPNAEYLIGLARGRGIEVEIPTASSLLRFDGRVPFQGVEQSYVGRYGVLA